VLVPHATLEDPVSCETYARTTFKTKTDKHRVRKQGRAATAREPLPETAAQLIDTFVTAQRVAQAIDEVCGGEADKTATGRIISWINTDVQKEAADEIAALGVDFARLKGEIASAARTHFMAAIQTA